LFSTLNVDLGTTPTFKDLPLEILGNHIFKFFDFEYWLKSFVVVSKYWQLAAVQSTVDKQLRVRKVGIVGIVKQYKVSTLIVKFSPHLPELVTLIKASPRVRSVKLKREVYNLRETAEPSLIAKYSCSNVSTLYISASQLHLLRFFPNATRVCLSTSHTYYSQNFTSHSVLELALPETTYKLPERLANIKGRFPALQIIHFLLVDKEEHQSEEEVRAELSATANELGVSLEYSCHFDSNSPIVLDTYDGHFNNFGRTAFIHALAFENGMQKVFQQFPALTLEYEQDFIHRKPQFVFPHMKANRDGPKHLLDINWNNYIEHLPLCFEKNILPPAGVVSYQLNCLNDYKAAIQIIKLHQGIEITNLLKKATSLVQVSIDLGVEIFQKLIDEESVLYERICSEDVKYEDLTPIRDLFTKKVLKYTYKHLLRELSHLNETKWQYLIQIDSWLHPNSRPSTNQEGIGIQYLSDESQAKHFACLLEDNLYDQLEAEAQIASKQLNQVFHEGTSLLGYCSNDTTEIVNRFALDVNQPDKNGITPIIHAISRGDQQQLEELLQLGADPNFACNTSLPLHYSLQNNSGMEVISTLVLFGADVNRKDYDSKGRSVWPITLAGACPNAYQMVKFLLAQGADPMVIDIAGNTLLHMLLREDFCLETAPLIDSLKLLALHVDINKKNNLGESVLHRAVSGTFIKVIVETLVKCGADVNLPDAKGRTPLLLAICYGASLGAFKALLATNKVDIKAKTNKGQSFVSLFLQHSKPSAFMKGKQTTSDTILLTKSSR
jgi:ankyrin repeat protein